MENFLTSLEIVQTIFIFMYLINALFRKPLQSARHCMITTAFIVIMEVIALWLGGTASVLLIILYTLVFITSMAKYNKLKRRVR